MSLHTQSFVFPQVNTTQTQQQHMEPPSIIPKTPYDLMIDDVVNKVLTGLKTDPSLVNEQRVIDLIKSTAPKPEVNRDTVESIIKEVIKNVQPERTIITIHNKRTNTVTETDEPTHKALAEVIGVLGADCWCAIVGATGSGKTLGAIQYAKLAKISILGIKQMCNTLQPHELIGFIDANGKYRKGAWTDAIIGRVYENNGTMPECDNPTDTPALITIDEMDNANSNIIMLVKALQTGIITMPYGQQRINPSLQVCATMNTWGTGATREYVGRMAQDAALLNEFQFVEWDYDTDFEMKLIEQTYRSFGDNVGDYKLEHMHKLHSMFIAMRQKAQSGNVRVIISTRNIINVVKMLLSNPTWTVHGALKKSVYKGLKEEEWRRIEAPEHFMGHGKHGHASQPETKPQPTNCPI